MDRTSKYLNNGYKVYDSCYEDASHIVEKATRDGYRDIKIQRVRTDTKGLKCFFVWVR